MSVCQQADSLNSSVLRSRQKPSSEGVSLTWGGREFQALATHTGNTKKQNTTQTENIKDKQKNCPGYQSKLSRDLASLSWPPARTLRRPDSYNIGADSSVQFSSSAILDPRVGHTMDELSLHWSLSKTVMVCHSEWTLHAKFGPRADVVYPSRTWSSSPTSTGHCSLHNLFFQSISSLSDDATIHTSFIAFTKSNSSRVIPAASANTGHCKLSNNVPTRLTWKEFLDSILAEKLDHVVIEPRNVSQMNSVCPYVCWDNGRICQPRR